ncbi:MAG: hypothetical protein ABJM43_04980 [Paracoccaceae bacterium]
MQLVIVNKWLISALAVDDRMVGLNLSLINKRVFVLRLLAPLVAAFFLMQPTKALTDGGSSSIFSSALTRIDNFQECHTCPGMIAMPQSSLITDIKSVKSRNPLNAHDLNRTNFGQSPDLGVLTPRGYVLLGSEPLQLTECLHRQSGGMPDVNSKINWPYVRSQIDLESCVFMMAEVLADIDSLRTWLGANEFKTSEPQEVSKHTMQVIFNKDDSGWSLSAGQPRSKIRLRMGFIDRFLIAGISIGIYLDADGKPLWVKTTYTRT